MPKKSSQGELKERGASEIRTHGPLQTPVFETGTINQTPPPLPREECVGFEPTIHLAMNSDFQDQCDQPDSANTPNTVFSKPITRIPLLI